MEGSEGNKVLDCPLCKAYLGNAATYKTTCVAIYSKS